MSVASLPLAFQVRRHAGWKRQIKLSTCTSTLDKTPAQTVAFPYPVQDSETSETMKPGVLPRNVCVVWTPLIWPYFPFWKLPRLKTRKPSSPKLPKPKTTPQHCFTLKFPGRPGPPNILPNNQLTKRRRANSERSPIQSTLREVMSEKAVCSSHVELCTRIVTKVAEAAMSRILRRLRPLQLQKPRRLFLACMCTTSSAEQYSFGQTQHVHTSSTRTWLSDLYRQK